ncbi:putative phage-related protein [Gracilibacillus halophilus YIM-C55.5]|uniref:Putative phage-related protein n=1 Tax=Gracilibacillus halophilus YIM-C55.5 TaxID=1308866 RepID=N4WUD3_9BACI|nr:hypothetical protein [Gracilibacillus halophilus]ENH96726.1 putative phage-related protein [Gracilibacillus halophilus YIM-C55.5]
MADLKRNMIELVKEIKQGELVTEKYLTPLFIPMKMVYEAIDMMEEMESSAGSAKSEKEIIDKLSIFVVRLYDDQFTKEELLNGLHGPTATQKLQEQVLFAARGMQDDDTKKYLAMK